MGDCGEQDLGTGQDTTRPDDEGGEEVLNGTADVWTGEGSTARKRDRSRKVDLLDANGRSGSRDAEGEGCSQDAIKSGLGEEREGQGPLENVVLPDPSSGVGQKLTQVEVTRLSWWIQWSSPWEGLMRRRLWRGVRIPSNLTPGLHRRNIVHDQLIS